MSMKVQYHDIANETYQDIWDFQTLLNNDIKHRKRSLSTDYDTNKAKDYFSNHLVFCEHKPVFTLGKSADEKNLLVALDELEAQGIECFKINRGGDITYHGPGQITGYLIFDLELLYRDVHRFVRNIEEAVIQFLAIYGLEGLRLDDYTGVWLGSKQLGYRKICAIGVHLSRWVSMHGFALNINTDIGYFDKIIPCGISDEDKQVTSLSRELGRPLDLEECKSGMLDALKDIFKFEIIKI